MHTTHLIQAGITSSLSIHLSIHLSQSPVNSTGAEINQQINYQHPQNLLDEGCLCPFRSFQVVLAGPQGFSIFLSINLSLFTILFSTLLSSHSSRSNSSSTELIAERLNASGFLSTLLSLTLQLSLTARLSLLSHSQSYLQAAGLPVGCSGLTWIEILGPKGCFLKTAVLSRCLLVLLLRELSGDLMFLLEGMFSLLCPQLQSMGLLYLLCLWLWLFQWLCVWLFYWLCLWLQSVGFWLRLQSVRLLCLWFSSILMHLILFLLCFLASPRSISMFLIKLLEVFADCSMGVA